MIETQVGPEEGEVDDDLTASDLLALARRRKAVEDRAAADLLDLAARWADLHPPESIHHAASFTVPGSEHEEPIAGEACPLVAEFCIAELGAALCLSSIAAKKLIGHALELRHRLPRLWDQVHTGRVPAWRARLVAETTIHTVPTLTPEAAGWVDGQVASVAGKVGAAQLDRLVAEAIKRYDLSQAPRPDDEAGEDHEDFLADQHLNGGDDPRHVTFDSRHVHHDGVMRMEAELDLADAHGLDAAITHGAALFRSLGSLESLGARRAAALGDLARTQTALDLHTQNTQNTQNTQTDGTAPAQRTGDGLPAARAVILHVHLDASLLSDDTGSVVETAFGPTARLEKGQRLALLDQVKPGAPPRGPRSPSDPSSTSTPSSPHPTTPSPTGSANR